MEGELPLQLPLVLVLEKLRYLNIPAPCARCLNPTRCNNLAHGSGPVFEESCDHPWSTKAATSCAISSFVSV